MTAVLEVIVVGTALGLWAFALSTVSFLWRSRTADTLQGALDLLEKPRWRFGALHGYKKGLPVSLEVVTSTVVVEGSPMTADCLTVTALSAEASRRPKPLLRFIDGAS